MRKHKKHAKIAIPIWLYPVTFLIILVIFGIVRAIAAASGSTIEVTLPSSTSIAASATSQDFNFSANTSGTDPIELPSGWDESQYIAVEVSVTNPVANPSETQLDSAPVYRNVDGSNNPLCRVNIGSSADIASSTPGTNYGNTAQTTMTVGSESIVIIGDRTPSVTINGTYSSVLSVLANVRISCTSGNFAGRYVRLGVVPSESPISFANSAGTTINSSLYYLFSTQRYYRFQRETTIATDSNTTDRLKQLWDDAKARTISVDGIANSGQTRYGWVATLTERDEIELADRLGTGNFPMIGLTDFGGPVDGSSSYTWNWDTTAWGAAPSPSTCATFEANIRWLGPDSWCTRVPAPYFDWNTNGFQNDAWSLCSNVWQPSACTGGITATATINFNSTNLTTNGWGLYHAWHIGGSRVDEPNSSGDFFYTGYSSGGNVGWDDAGVSDSHERSDARNKTDTHNFYIAEYCAPNNPCTPPAAAISSTRLRIDQTITFAGAAASYSTQTVNLTAASTTSGLSITYSSSNTDICTVNSSAVVTLISQGTCQITASQSGNDSYNAATSVSQSFTSNFGPLNLGLITDCSSISESTNAACPFTRTIISGRSASINVFTDATLSANERSRGGIGSFIAAGLSVRSGSGSVTRVESNRSMQFTSPNSTGTSIVRFRVTNSNNDTADADATFNVVADLTQTAPTIIPVDPRALFVDLPQIDILGSSVSKVLLCYRQSQSNGTDLSSGHSLATTVRTTSSNTISNDGSTSEVSINGTIANVETSSISVRITNSNGGAVLDSNTSKYLRVRVSGDDDLSADNCANGSSADQSKVIELKPVELETTRRLDVNVD